MRVGDCEIASASQAQLRAMREELQIVFQDPFASLDPRMQVADIVAEPLVAMGVHWLCLWLAGWPLALAWNVAVLYLTLGFRQFSHHFTGIRDALDAGDEERARQLLARWQQVDASALPRSEIVRHVIEYSVLSAHRHVFGVLAWYSVLSMLGLGPAGLGRLLDWRLILRAALIVGAIASILTALRTEPIANVFGAFFIGPIVAYVLSALLLGESVSWARTVMLALGFAGVLLVVRPGGEMGTGMIFAVLAGTLYGSYLAATRWLTAFYPPPFLLGSQLLIGAVLLLPAGLASIPASTDLRVWVLVIVSSLASAFGNYLLVVVNRTTPATVSAPLIYFQLIAATVIGFLVFGDWPEPLTLLGLAVIFASGVGGLALVPRR